MKKKINLKGTEAMAGPINIINIRQKNFQNIRQKNYQINKKKNDNKEKLIQ